METVGTFSELSQAQMLKSLLESAGIDAFIPDELTAQTAPPYVWATGGVRLQVPTAQAETARRILAEAMSSNG